MSERHVITLSDDQIWDELASELSDIRDLLNMRLETKEEAVGKPKEPSDKKGRLWETTSPKWKDDSHGFKVRAWLLLPYIEGIDQELVRLQIDLGKRLLPDIERQIRTRQLTPTFVLKWGQLKYVGGALALLDQDKPSIGAARAAIAGGQDNLDERKAWYSKHCNEYFSNLRLELAHGKMAEYINNIDGGITSPPSGYTKDWFGRFLIKSAKPDDSPPWPLTLGFQRLSWVEMKKRAKLHGGRSIEQMHEP